ncbi:hypothetical protein [Chitinophaga niabensis]|uniref:Uncharacterized protein n=1 Tax=Chitinophaga niabensis TaxID=536979 RepID=A0A1N6K6B5_9BACT|nr:hypothetical protein [Chitinophaga niabensis]SIO51846.1 hypothetical protein SAMN04488055_5122 [Chitinophaga niabensis]
MKIIFFLCFGLMICIRSNAQKLPKAFSDGLSGMICPIFTSQDSAVDMYTVAILLSPGGKVLKTMFSQGTPDSLKPEIMHRIAIARIGLTPLSEYWEKFCSENAITDNTCIIQPVLLRFEDTDTKTFTIEEVTNIYTKAMTFDDPLIAFRQKLNIIWLAPKTARLVHTEIVN